MATAPLAGIVTEWRAMGSTARVRFHAGDGRPEALVRRVVEDLEQRWSRFRPDSEVCRLNASAGRGPLAVSPPTIALIADAVLWWRATGGRFDPTVLPALIDAGYDRDLALGHGPIGAGHHVPGCEGIIIDRAAGTIALPSGVALDLGGIGKGTAVDLAVEALDGVAGGLVELGGDLRVWGAPTDDAPGWPVAVADPRDGSTVAVLGLADGAVATSTTLLRRWSDGERTAHHLIDPCTGRPADGPLASVTVVAGRAGSAEVLAKAAILAGEVDEAVALLAEHGVAAILIPHEGEPWSIGGVDALCWESAEVRH